jgi:hypothetical protein
MEQYDFKQELEGISEQWHKIILPDEVFGKVSQELTDIRIFGITASNDTVEVPYILRLATENTIFKDIAFKNLNDSKNDKGYFFTFELLTTEPINQIQLNFKQENFDWRVGLEGSQNQVDWFTILEDYRVLSIKNDMTDFHFTRLSFPDSKYRFFRLFIDSKEKPLLSSASIALNVTTNGTLRNYNTHKTEIRENRETKQTEIYIELQIPVAVSQLKIAVKDSFDYYRPVTIQCLTDSIKTEQGWKYNYSTLTSGILNSIDKKDFRFNSRTMQKLKILIHNHDNQPLTIDAIHVQGYEHELLARFTERATYFLTYGNSSAKRPHYDIERFIDNVPEALKTLVVDQELIIEKTNVSQRNQHSINKTWLWIVITLTILILGWFTIKMMRKENDVR